MADAETQAAAIALLNLCKAKKLTLATAESCTGGLVVGALTDVAGSSAVIDRGFVTYSDQAKQEMLGVPTDLLKQHGAVSRETAQAMVSGVLARAPVDLAVSITGIAGPGGGSPTKPVGLVHFAAATRGGRMIAHEQRYGDIGRAEVRRRSVLQALSMLSELAVGEPPKG